MALLQSADPLLFEDVCVGAGGPIASHAGSTLSSQRVQTAPADVTVLHDGMFLLVVVEGVIVGEFDAEEVITEEDSLALTKLELGKVVDGISDSVRLEIIICDVLVLCNWVLVVLRLVALKVSELELDELTRDPVLVV